MSDSKEPKLSIELFYDLNDQEIAIIYNLLFEKSFPEKGQQIISQGNINHGLYILKSGDVNECIQAFGDTNINLQVLSKGSYFGAISLLGCEYAMSTIITKEPVECYYLSVESLEYLCVSEPEIGYMIKRNIAKILCKRFRDVLLRADSLDGNKTIIGNRLPKLDKQSLICKINKESISDLKDIFFTIKFFREMSKEKFMYLYDFLHICKARKFQALYIDNNLVEKFYIVLQGAFQSYIKINDSYCKFKVYGPGDLIGGLEMFDQGKRVTTCFAREDSLLICISRDELEKIKNDAIVIWHKLLNMIYLEITDELIAMLSLIVRLQSQSFLQGVK